MNISIAKNNPGPKTRPAVQTEGSDLSREQLREGLDKLLLSTTQKGHHEHWEIGQAIGRHHFASKVLPETEGSTASEIGDSLKNSAEKAKGRWVWGMLLPVGFVAGVAGLLFTPGVGAVAAVAFGATLGAGGMAVQVTSDKKAWELKAAQAGLQDAVEWTGRELDPPLAREQLLGKAQEDMDRRAATGQLKSLWKAKQRAETIEDARGQDVVEQLKSMSAGEATETAQWLHWRESRKLEESEQARPQLPLDTPLDTIEQRVRQSRDRLLAGGRYEKAILSMETLSALQSSQAEDWSGFMHELTERNSRSFKAPSGQPLWAGAPSRQELQNRVDFAMEAFLKDDAEPVNPADSPSREDLEQEFAKENETRFLNDYPRENRARRALDKIPGANLIEMANQPGEKNQKRLKMVLQALLDSKLEWIIGTD